MGARKREPFLHWRERVDGAPVWEIRDGSRRVSTQTRDQQAANRALTAYRQNPDRNIEGSLSEDESALRREVSKSLRAAKWRSGNKGMKCDVTVDLVMEIIKEQGGVCAISGLGFFTKSSKESKRRPYAPSIDRIDNRLGYEDTNIRVVLSIVNNAKADFSDAEFFTMCSAVAGFGILSGPKEKNGV